MPAALDIGISMKMVYLKKKKNSQILAANFQVLRPPSPFQSFVPGCSYFYCINYLSQNKSLGCILNIVSNTVCGILPVHHVTAVHGVAGVARQPEATTLWVGVAD